MLYLAFWVLMSGLLFVVPELGLGANAASHYSNIIQIVSALVCAILCWRTMAIFERNDSMYWVWLFIGAGVFSWFIGQSLYAGYVVINNAEPPYPWYADIGYLAIQPLIVIGLIIFIRNMPISPPIWGAVLSIVLFIIAMIISIQLLYPNLIQATNDIEYITVIGYILFDPVLLAVTVLTASLMAGGQLAYPWWFCFGGLTLYYLANVIFHYQLAQNQYVSGNWVDIGWVLSFVLIGMAPMLVYDMMNVEEEEE